MPKPLNVSLWIGQILLALMFTYAGLAKLFQPIDQLSQMLPWATEYPELFVRLVGAADLLGGLGVLLPTLLRIKPKLASLAALGILAIMVLALGFHVLREEYQALGMNVFLGILAAFVAWGRQGK